MHASASLDRLPTARKSCCEIGPSICVDDHRWIEGWADGPTIALLRPVFSSILAALMERRSKLFTPPKFVFVHSFSSWAHNPIEGGPAWEKEEGKEGVDLRSGL